MATATTTFADKSIDQTIVFLFRSTFSFEEKQSATQMFINKDFRTCSVSVSSDQRFRLQYSSRGGETHNWTILISLMMIRLELATDDNWPHSLWTCLNQIPVSSFGNRPITNLRYCIEQSSALQRCRIKSFRVVFLLADWRTHGKRIVGVLFKQFAIHHYF